MRRVKIVKPTLKDCLVIYERFKRYILCFELNTVNKTVFLERGFSKRLETKTSFAPWPCCFERRKQKRRKDGRTNIRDVHASWNLFVSQYKSANVLSLVPVSVSFHSTRSDLTVGWFSCINHKLLQRIATNEFVSFCIDNRLRQMAFIVFAKVGKGRLSS